MFFDANLRANFISYNVGSGTFIRYFLGFVIA
jgi:hypothetical protein